MPAQPCPICQTENRLEARYCKQCGFWLLANCPFCNASLPERAFFCDACGRALNAQASLAIPPIPSDRAAPASARVAPPGRLMKSPPEGTTASQPSPAGSELQQYIPPELMRKLEAARETGGMVGERRVVTMLFCDVQGSTAAADRLERD